MLITDNLDLLLDSEGDLTIANGDLALVSGLAAIRQLVQIQLSTFKGEWFLDLDLGVPYFQEILGGVFNAPRARAIIRKALLAVEGVNEITKLEVTFDSPTRVMTVAWEVTTLFGDTSGEVSV